MSKLTWKAGNMLYPLPAVLVTVADKAGNKNILTVAWAGTVCTNPPMVSISVRPERHSYPMICESGEFVINLTTQELSYATDYCGVVSGRDVDKFQKCALETEDAINVSAPLLKKSPVNIECQVVEKKELGSHHMFIAKVLCVHVDETYMDDKGKFDLSLSDPLVYSHGEYYSLGEKTGTFGYSIKKKK